MKTMTCKQLGGACNEESQANTFKEMADMSRKHGMEMARKGDEQHINAMEEMKTLMTDSKAMQEWMDNVRKEFAELPEHNPN